ncbi:energy transducer TonB [Pseudomonas mucidolens]|uniref:Energy transducer TonB n=1 Tax=Pseudomonas mucidolens TaxID=46679 RepID=A0A1H2NHY7_9PSED|nr:energy transducer TonB [Pseudomonas mucidolens]SDV05089.1 hypothetical protein SAMN05216202_3787 [Pseudomonas mucidolens]SQH31877.1 protein TonB [Pseudomonas mucidolens]
MQVVNWLPRTELPFAAPSRPELLQALEPFEPFEVSGEEAAAAVAVAKPAAQALERPTERARVEVPRPSSAARPTPVVEDTPAPVVKAPVVPPPRFALQLLRAGRCLLLVELPTGERFQTRDPAYLLLKDMLRAAGLPDSPQIVGEPVRWPLLVRGTMDQGPEAARDFVQSFVSARLEDEPCACLWLIGLPAVRFAGEANAEAWYRQLQVEGLGVVWALPGLELLMEEPQRKAEVWQAMRRLMALWKSTHE